jgi:hypothetical protein
MKHYMQFFFLFFISFIVVACAPDKINRDYNQKMLYRARDILDNWKNGTNSVNGLDNLLLPAGVKTPQEWALFEIRVYGDATDISRCLPYMKSENFKIRQEAERTFVFLSKPDEKYELADLLDSKEIPVRNLVLSYSGYDSVNLSNVDIQQMMESSNRKVRTLARKLNSMHQP